MYELDKDSFGKFLAGLRREKGLTQRQLAEKLFVSDKAVSKWERGVSQRSRDRLHNPCLQLSLPRAALPVSMAQRDTVFLRSNHPVIL